MTVHTTMDSPLGELLLVGERSTGAKGGTALSSVSVGTGRLAGAGQWADAEFGEIVRQIRGYFAGDVREFDLTYTTNGTPFQESVWAALDGIPYGTTVSYGELARRIGAPRDRVRAVGAAVGANPLPVLRPCHRVIGADGRLVGYALGLDAKRFLLTHEGALQAALL